MTTIFSRSYAENLLRLSARAKPEPQTLKFISSSKPDFIKALGDLEKPSETLTENTVPKVERQLPQIPKSILSNLNQNETNAANEILSSAKFDTSTPTVAAIFESNSVKIPGVDVKNTVIPESAIPNNVAPTAPVIMGFKRLSPTAQDVADQYARQDVQAIVRQAGTFHGVDPTLSLAIAKAESDFQTNAVSHDGFHSKGLFQLLDTTGREMLSRSDLGKEPYDPFNPHLNAHLGVGYLKRLFETFQTPTDLKGGLKTVAAKSAVDLEKLAIAAFNAGEGNVARAQERAMALGKNPAEFTSVEPHLPESTRAYVRRVLKLRNEMQPESVFDGTA